MIDTGISNSCFSFSMMGAVREISSSSLIWTCPGRVDSPPTSRMSLLAASRKSVIGLTLDLPADQREEGTIAATVYGMMNGCSFVRVHDVKANRRAVQMIEAICQPRSISTETVSIGSPTGAQGFFISRRILSSMWICIEGNSS